MITAEERAVLENMELPELPYHDQQLHDANPYLLDMHYFVPRGTRLTFIRETDGVAARVVTDTGTLVCRDSDVRTLGARLHAWNEQNG